VRNKRDGLKEDAYQRLVEEGWSGGAEGLADFQVEIVRFELGLRSAIVKSISNKRMTDDEHSLQRL
jgi:hypothetical protein